MLSANNLLRPQDGGPVTVPTQDMVLGSYYLTMDRMGRAEKGAETIWCADAGDTDLTANSVVDATRSWPPTTPWRRARRRPPTSPSTSTPARKRP